MIDIQALNQDVAAQGNQLMKDLKLLNSPEIDLYVDIADLCFDPE